MEHAPIRNTAEQVKHYPQCESIPLPLVLIWCLILNETIHCAPESFYGLHSTLYTDLIIMLICDRWGKLRARMVVYTEQ